MPVIDYQICLAQPTAQAETWQSISALNGSALKRERVSCGMDYVTFSVNGASAFTAAEAYPYKSVVRLRRVVNGVPSYWFCGRVMSIPRKATGRSERHVVRIEGPWSWFENCTFRQPWAAAGGGRVKPRVILYCDASGNRATTGSQIIQAAEFARAAGAPIAQVTSATVAEGFTPPFDEQLNIKVADVICKALAHHPHAVCWFDYSQRDPVFHVASRLSLSAVGRSISGRQDISIEERRDMQVPAVAICYERVSTEDGAPIVETSLDYAPTVENETDEARDARLAEADVVWACYSLAGAQITTASQLIEAAAFPFPLANKAWWRARVPWLNDISDDDLTITGAERLDDSTLANVLVSGTPQPWMSVAIETERVRADIAYVRRTVIDGVSQVVAQGVKSVTIEIQVTGAPTGQTLYRAPLSVDDGEPVPSGVAAELFAEWSQLHYQGDIVFVSEDVDGEVAPGRSLNLTGGLTEWASMAAMVIRCSESVDEGETAVTFGIPDWTDVDSRVAFARSTRTRQPAASRVWLTGFSAAGVTGGLSAALQREGNSDAIFVRQLFTASGSVRHMIAVDADAVSKSVDASVASVLAPREMLLPFVDTGDGDKVKAKLAQVLASPLYGDALPLGPDMASEAPQPVGTEAAVGESSKAAREDHVHAGAALSDATPAAVAATGDAGESASAARADHVHAGVQLGSSTPATLDGSATAGTATTAARQDHKHALNIAVPGPGPDTGAPVQDGGTDVMPAPTGFLGTSGDYSRRDHIHPVNVDDAVNPADVGATADPGESNRYARADHVHAGAAATPSDPGTVTDLGVNGEGSSDSADTGTWTAGTSGKRIWVVTRIRLDNSSATSNFIAYLRPFILTSDGRLYSCGAESAVVISGTTTAA